MIRECADCGIKSTEVPLTAVTGGDWLCSDCQDRYEDGLPAGVKGIDGTWQVPS